MPLSDYFSGSGEKVMSAMQKEYGSDKGKKVFYATANSKKKSKKHKKKGLGPSENFRGHKK